jgi:hypothetical protein
MALITCKDCKKEFSTDVRRCPHCGAKKPASKIVKYGLTFIVLIFVIAQFEGQKAIKQAEQRHAASNPAPPPVQPPDYPADAIEKANFILKSDKSDSMAVTSGIADLRSVKKEDGEDRYKEAQKLIEALEKKRNAMPSPTPPITAGNWRVQHAVSSMDDTQGVYLELEAENTISAWLKNPKPYLYIRCQEKKTEIYVQTGTSAQPELGNYNQATVRIRLDKNAAFRQSWSESTDKEALFAPSGVSLAKQIAKAKQMAFEFVPFNSPPAIVYFNVAGLDEHIGKVAEACKWKK